MCVCRQRSDPITVAKFLGKHRDQLESWMETPVFLQTMGHSLSATHFSSRRWKRGQRPDAGDTEHDSSLEEKLRETTLGVRRTDQLR